MSNNSSVRSSSWRRLVDPNTLEYFFVNKETGEKFWETTREDLWIRRERPTECDYVFYENKLTAERCFLDNPRHWKIMMSKTYKRPYWHHQSGKYSSWVDPVTWFPEKDKWSNPQIEETREDSPFPHLSRKLTNVITTTPPSTLVISHPKVWSVYVDPKTRHRFFYNSATGQRQWNVPKEEHDWVIGETKTGRKYFFNPVTKKSVWDLPSLTPKSRRRDTPLSLKKDDQKSSPRHSPPRKSSEDEKNIQEARRRWSKAVTKIKRALRTRRSLLLSPGRGSHSRSGFFFKRPSTKVPIIAPPTKKKPDAPTKENKSDELAPGLKPLDSFNGLPNVVERAEHKFEDVWVQGVLRVTHDDVIFEPEAKIKNMKAPPSNSPSPPPGLKNSPKRERKEKRRRSLFGHFIKGITHTLGFEDIPEIQKMPFAELQELDLDKKIKNAFTLHPRASGDALQFRFDSEEIMNRMRQVILMRRRVAISNKRRESITNGSVDELFEDVTADELGSALVTRKNSLWGSKSDELKHLGWVYVYEKKGLFMHDWCCRILWHDVGQGWIRYSIPEEPSSCVQSEGWFTKGAMLHAIDAKSRNILSISERIDLLKEPIPGLRLECAISADRHTSSTKMGSIKMLCPGVFQFLSLVRNFERAGIALNGPLQRMLNEYENQDDKLKHLHLMRNSDFKSWWPVVEWSSIWRRFESVNVKMFLLENISGANYTNYPEPLTIIRESYAAREALIAVQKTIGNSSDIPTYDDVMSKIRCLFDENILNSIDLATRTILRRARIMAMSTLDKTTKTRDVVWSAPSKFNFESFGHYEVAIEQNSSWNEIVSVERRVSRVSSKLSAWKRARGYDHGSIHGKSKALMNNMGHMYENEIKESKTELMRMKVSGLDNATRYRLVFDRSRRDDVRLLLFKPETHFKTRYPMSLVQKGKKVEKATLPKPEFELSILCASVRGDAMDLQMNRIVLYCWDTSNRKVSVSLSAESGLEQLCQTLSALNAYGAILDNRTGALEAFASKSRDTRQTKDVKRILDMFKTREGEDEEDEKIRLSTSGRLIDNETREKNQKKKGEWFDVSDILPSHRISQLETKIDAEFRSLQFRKRYLASAIVDTSENGNSNTTTALSSEHLNTAVEPALSDIYSLNKDDDDVMIDLLKTHHNLHGRIAVFVLGPSAAGKTYLTRKNLSKVLRSNHLFEASTKEKPAQAFVSIDGGLTRDVSKMWQFMSTLPRYMNVARDSVLPPVLGFSDLFGGYFKKRTGDFKLRLFRSLLRKGINMIIPDTAADVLLGVHEGKAGYMLRKLHESGYSVLMTAVSASKAKCRDNGHHREIKEGKKYSSRSWQWATGNIPVLFNHARSLGYHDKTFYVWDNTDWSKPSPATCIRPNHGLTLNFGKDENGEKTAVFHEVPM